MGKLGAIVMGTALLSVSALCGFGSWGSFHRYYNPPEEVRMIENMKPDFINKGYSDKQYKKVLDSVEGDHGGSIGGGLFFGALSLSFLVFGVDCLRDKY